MMNLRGKNICDFAIAVFGKTEQENMCMEECAELIQAINKKHRGKAHNLAEEIADVEICLEQLKMINSCHAAVEIIKAEKLERLCQVIEKVSERR